MTKVGHSETSKFFAAAQNVLLVLFAAVAFFAPKNLLFVSNAARVVGNVVALFGVLLILVAVVALRRVVQVAPAPKQNGELVQSGAYKYLRHPIYTGVIFCAVGFFLRTPTVWIGIASLAVILFLYFKAQLEEKLLGAAYPSYAEYRQRAWGIFPGLR